MEKIENQSIAKQEFLWKIENFKLANVIKFEEDQKLESEKIEIYLGENKTEWKLLLYPNTGDYSEFFVHKESADRDDFIIRINVEVLNNAGEIEYSHRLEKDGDEFNGSEGSAWGFPKILYINEILSKEQTYLTNGTLTLRIKLELIQEGPPVKKPRYCSNAGLLVAEYFNSEDFSDMTIICSDDEKIPAHRNILAGRSAVLKRMLLTDMIEKNLNEIKVEDIDSTTMLELMRYIYREEVHNIEMHAPKLFDYAEKYEIPGLKTICIDELINQLSDENIFQHIQRAKMYNERKLMNACMSYIRTNFSNLKRSQNWKQLDSDLMIDIMEFMRDGPNHVITFTNSL